MDAGGQADRCRQQIVDQERCGGNQAGSAFIYWGNGSGIVTMAGATTSDPYNNIGHFQVIQTVTNPCGYKATKIFIVNVTGGGAGKGSITITSTGTGKYRYDVNETGSPVSLTDSVSDVTVPDISTIILESRIVAMSFCEPRSWTRVLSS